MAVGLQKPKSRKRQEIEPLDWSAMSQSPALKGTLSFLEVTPEDIRRQQSKNGDSRIGSDTLTGSDASIVGESLTGSGPHTDSDTLTGTVHCPNVNGFADSIPDVNLIERTSSALPRGDSHIVSEPHTGNDAHIGSEARTGLDTRDTAVNEIALHVDKQEGGFYADLREPGAGTAPASVTSGVANTEPIQSSISDVRTGSETVIGSDTAIVHRSRTGSEARIGSETHTAPQEFTRFKGNTESTSGPALPSGVSHSSRGLDASSTSSDSGEPVSDTRIGNPSVSETRTGQQAKPTYYVGPDSYPRPQRRMAMLQGEVVWQNRKIRKCVLAQDAHSQGEDALFSAMWNAAKPEASDPTGSRTLRIGYAELSQKSRMHRSNVRINIAGLRAKLAIEVLDEHDSRDVMPRLYRLYSYKEILERRRAAGLEYVIRKKSVVFVTESGELVALPGLPKTASRKAPRQSVTIDPEAANYASVREYRAEQLDLDVSQISNAMSQHWPVDEAAAQHLLRQCKSVRRDAEIGEIVFFINEKLQVALTNKNIKNPTGLILATVPQCFEGATFQEFRRRRHEALRLAAEEQERKQLQERELQAWLDARLLDLRAIAEDDRQPDTAREKARRELRQYNG